MHRPGVHLRRVGHSETTFGLVCLGHRVCNSEEATGKCDKRLKTRWATGGKVVGEQEAAVTKPLQQQSELEAWQDRNQGAASAWQGTKGNSDDEDR